MASSTSTAGESARPSYAGLSPRIAAHLLDLAISVSVLLIAGLIMRILVAAGLLAPDTAGADPLALWKVLGWRTKLLSFVGCVLSMGPIYFALFESSQWQATLGKRLLNIYVTGDDAVRISIARSFGRWIARFVIGWFGGSLVSIGTIAATGKKKALHDYVAGTLVLKGQPGSVGALDVWRIVLAFGFPFLWFVGMDLAIFAAA